MTWLRGLARPEDLPRERTEGLKLMCTYMSVGVGCAGSTLRALLASIRWSIGSRNDQSPPNATCTVSSCLEPRIDNELCERKKFFVFQFLFVLTLVSQEKILCFSISLCINFGVTLLICLAINVTKTESTINILS